MDWDGVDAYFLNARRQVVGLRPQVKDEIASGAPCLCCGVKLRPVVLQGIAQAFAQRIFMQHVDECDYCNQWSMCPTGRKLASQLPEDMRTVCGRVVF